MLEHLTVTKENVASIIAAWWAEYEADPSKFQDGPDHKGEASAETFFRIAKERGFHD